MKVKKNPFLNIPQLPDFAAMTPALADKAMPELLKQTKLRLDELEKSDDVTWDGFIIPLNEASEELFKAWGLIGHFLSVCNSGSWRKVQDKYQSELVMVALRIGQNPSFYARLKKMRQTPSIYDSLSPVRRRILDKSLQAMERSGVALDGEKQERFCEISQRLAKLSSDYQNNVLDATDAFSIVLKRPSEVEGLPESLLETAAQRAKGDAKKGPWKIKLDSATLGPFFQYSRNPEAREKLFRANITRASFGKTDNTAIIGEYLELERELARLLGFSNYAELSLSSKMAKTVEAVDSLIALLAEASREKVAEEERELAEFEKRFGEPIAAMSMENAPWNRGYWIEKQHQALYGYDSEELSRYFVFERVLKGMFELAERLFGITIHQREGVSVWHKDVRFYQVEDSATGAELGGFYLDPYSRPGSKSSGAWMNEFASRYRSSDGRQVKPLAVVVCNQTAPVGRKPSVMRFSEVTTLFHEFGHCLQHLLTEVEDQAASGVNGIEWDAVEIASQFMENWCYDRRLIKAIGVHADTGEPIPAELFDRVVAARNYRAANFILRQLSFGAMDMDLYARYPQYEGQDIFDVEKENFKKYGNLPRLEEERFLCSFSHIFSGAYLAGYYSYMWSEVLSADVFAAFEEAGLDDEEKLRQIGMRYRKTFLAMGGGTDPAEVFRRFRGRDATVDALLRHSGLK